MELKCFGLYVVFVQWAFYVSKFFENSLLSMFGKWICPSQAYNTANLILIQHTFTLFKNRYVGAAVMWSDEPGAYTH
jgi:hypothetical protein